MKTKHLFIIIVLFLVVVGCRKAASTASQSLPPASQRVTVSEWDKVKISSSGEIFVNKRQMSLAEFAAECQRLKQAGGAALIYIGEGDHVLSPAQAEAFHKLADSGVPMKVAMKESELD
jgi:biopolymer transport protein ExbD